MQKKHFSTDDPFVYRPETAPAEVIQGPLTGRKLAVKDLFHMAGIATTAGNPDWLKSHSIPEQSSPVVTALLQAGAEFVGKTITDELAYSLNGQNIHYGTPVNFRHPERLNGGSTSGSALAVAAGLADIGLGTDTGGSIRVPASYNGLYGLRTTHGAISSEHMVPLAPCFDTVGWITRDLTLMQQVTSVLMPEMTCSEKASELLFAESWFSGMVWGGDFDAWRVRAIPDATGVQNQLKHLDLAEASNGFRLLQGREIWRQHGAWIEAQQPTFAPDIAERFAWCRSLTEEDEAQGRGIQRALQQQMAQLLGSEQILIMPTTPAATPSLQLANEGGLGDYRSQLMGYTAIAGLCGLPQLHIPLFDHPDNGCIGLSLLGNKGKEQDLIYTAQQLMERAK